MSLLTLNFEKFLTMSTKKLILLLALILATSSPANAGAKTANYSLFGSTEIHSNSLTPFTNWTGMLTRFQQNERLGNQMCNSDGEGQRNCSWTEWQNLIARVRNLPPMDQLREVNNFMNRKHYTLDRNNWGKEDYWETVFEFMRKNGDCEDYSIAKYVTLRALGWPANSLRIVILHDNKLDLNHAVLAAYMDDGIYIGDNQINTITRAENIHHYRPIYSLNEQGWWLHRPPVASR